MDKIPFRVTGDVVMRSNNEIRYVYTVLENYALFITSILAYDIGDNSYVLQIQADDGAKTRFIGVYPIGTTTPAMPELLNTWLMPGEKLRLRINSGSSGDTLRFSVAGWLYKVSEVASFDLPD
jgi:hypothetical protein